MYNLWHGLGKTFLNTSDKNPNQTYINKKKRGKIWAHVKEMSRVILA
jgi:hypothetical protein